MSIPMMAQQQPQMQQQNPFEMEQFKHIAKRLQKNEGEYRYRLLDSLDNVEKSLKAISTQIYDLVTLFAKANKLSDSEEK